MQDPNHTFKLYPKNEVENIKLEVTALTADEKLLGMIKINWWGLGRLGDGKTLTKWYPLYPEGDSLSHNEMLSEC